MFDQWVSQRHSGFKALAFVALTLVLAACGGGGGDAPLAAENSSPSASTAKANALPTPAQTEILLKKGAQLNAAELAGIAKTGVLPDAFAGKPLSGAEDAKSFSGGTTKSAASRVPTYRFFNTRTSAHFFTTSEAERANVQATLPFMNFEGPAFHASSTAIPGLSPVHRFYNNATGVHFYTISEAERAHVAATLPQFNYEGVAYHASTLPGTGYTPLYRFFYASKGFHFYTNSAAEKDNIIATLPQYNFEGVGYYVLGGDWQTPAVPHTGITAAQCYAEGADTLVTCTPSVKAIATGGTSVNLNPQQDGHRGNINPMSYSAVGSNPLTSCVRDDVTGLIWEGKTSGVHLRSGTNTHTNWGDGTPGDSSAYVNAVNALNLCGFSDWRMPLAEELHGIVHYGAASGTRITQAFFPNTAANGHWASNSDVSDGSAAWTSDFSNGRAFSQPRNLALSVRLVRGAMWTGPRYLVTTETYAGDGVNNAVIDRKTGLVWRRCTEGQLWSGNACSGNHTGAMHESALNNARLQIGWRLPNVKELGGLSDHSRTYPALDVSAFPGGDTGGWSSTPVGASSLSAMFVNADIGNFGFAGRTNGYGSRLVRTGS